MKKIPKAELKSMDVADDNRRQLAQLFPEVVIETRTEGGKLIHAVDFQKLKGVLGKFSEVLDNQPEHYGITWPGKKECLKIIQQPSIAALKPCRQESVNFDETDNLFIEGDNLEVLKLLQKTYYGKVKMIYIDPPYNTGKEFIYPDNYSESLETYLAYSGQVDAEGKRFRSNTEDAGRYHTNWLNMMYPRLYLARNLLKNSGVMFISIDDHEVKNLRAICDEVFGPENFIATIIWQRVYSPKNSAKYFSEDHDYILAYARNAEQWRPNLLPRTEAANARYTNPDNDPRGPWKPSDLTARNYYSEGQYEVTSPSGKKFRCGKGRYWRQSYSNFLQLQSDNRIWWGPEGNSMPALKRFLSEVQQGFVPQTLWFYKDVGHTQDAKKELLKYVTFEETENVLNSVKPTKLIKRMLGIGTNANSKDIVLDFFCGSGSTAHAVLAKNKDDGGNRRFILVQLPEPLPKKEEYVKTIADLAKSRIRNYGDELIADSNGKLSFSAQTPDVGFKVFNLTRSNFRLWDCSQLGDNPVITAKQLELHEQHIDPNSTQEDILFELLLKAGFPLSTKVNKIKMAGKEIFSIAEGELLICLQDEITKELIKAMADAAPLQVICLDVGFKNNDQLKVNAVQTFKARSRGKGKKSEIVFRTV